MNNLNWKNDNEVDAFIREGLLIANQPEDEDVKEFDYSPRYKRWEQGLLAHPIRFIKKTSRSAFRRVLDVAAVIVVTVAVLFSTLIAASPTVRAAVVRWFREIFPTHDAFESTQIPDTQTLPLWRPVYLPEGYAESFFTEVAGQIIVDFENEHEERITLSYSFLSENTIFRVDNDGMEIIETKIGEHTAQIYRSLDNSKRNVVVLINEDAGIVFMLTSFETSETLISIAESMDIFE